MFSLLFIAALFGIAYLWIARINRNHPDVNAKLWDVPALLFLAPFDDNFGVVRDVAKEVEPSPAVYFLPTAFVRPSPPHKPRIASKSPRKRK
jgi:hypothetical protein